MPDEFKPATLSEIADLGHEEKQVACEYAPTVAPMFAETAVRMAFLQGIVWERQRTTTAVLAGTEQEDSETRQWVLGLVSPKEQR